MATSTLSDFVELLGTDDRGLAWLTNLADSIAVTRTSPDSARIFLQAAFELHLESIGQGRFSDTADTAHLSLSATTKSDRFAATNSARQSVSNDVHSCEHITDFECLRDHHYDIESLLTEQYRDNEDQDRYLRDARIEDVIRVLTADDHRASLKSGAKLGFSRVWLTPPIDGQEAIATAIATQIRDKLGLVHYKTPDYLVAYQIREVDGNFAWAPTPLDGAGTRFRSLPDDWSAAGSWGMTINLKLFVDREDNIDGAREAVTTPITLDASHARTIKPLGSLIDERVLTTTDNDASFAQRLLRKRTAAFVIGTILEKVQTQ